MQDRLDKRVIAKISPLELKAGNVTVNSNTHHGVLKDSATSPIKLESYSSFPNGFIALTNLMVKGQNTLDNLFPNIIEFSDYEMAPAGSISKAVNGSKLKEEKRHVRGNLFKFYQNKIKRFLHMHIDRYVLKINSR